MPHGAESRRTIKLHNQSDLEDYVYEWTSTAETYLLALRRVAEEKLGVSLQSYLEAVEAGGADVDDAPNATE